MTLPILMETHLSFENIITQEDSMPNLVPGAGPIQIYGDTHLGMG